MTTKRLFQWIVYSIFFTIISYPLTGFTLKTISIGLIVGAIMGALNSILAAIENKQ